MNWSGILEAVVSGVIRRFASISPGSAEFRKELQEVRINLGGDYLEIIKKRLGSLKSEVIIAVENQQR